MKRTMLGGKIHRATVTDANLAYEGSVTIDATLLDAAGIFPNELVHVWDVTNGERLVTYAIPGAADSGVICVNGAAAHHVAAGDLIIIASYLELDNAEARTWSPRVVFVNEFNHISDLRAEEPFTAAG